MNVEHKGGWRFEVSRVGSSVPHIVQLDSKDPLEICDCKSTYYRTAQQLKKGEKLSSKICCAHVKAVALAVFDENILKEARKGL